MTEEEKPATIEPKEYRNFVEEIAIQVLTGVQEELYENIDEGINDYTKSHILVLDVNRASQVVSLSENTPEGYLKTMAPEDDWKQHISMQARFCLSKDIQDEIEHLQEKQNVGLYE